MVILIGQHKTCANVPGKPPFPTLPDTQALIKTKQGKWTVFIVYLQVRCLGNGGGPEHLILHMFCVNRLFMFGSAFLILSLILSKEVHSHLSKKIHSHLSKKVHSHLHSHLSKKVHSFVQ